MALVDYTGSTQAKTALLTNIKDAIQSLDTSVAALSAGSGVTVSANDATVGYLNGKLVAGTNVTLTEGSDGGDENLTIAVADAVTLTGTQTLTNKTLTSPTINTATLDEATINTSTINTSTINTSTIDEAIITQSKYNQIADASLGTGTHTFDYSAGDMQQLTASGDITIAFSNMPTGKVASMIIDAVNWGAHTITYPAGMLFDDGTYPTYTAAGTDRLQVVKDKDEAYTLSIINYDLGAGS